MDGALPALVLHAAVKAQMQVLLVAFFQRLLEMPEQRLSGKIATPVAEQALRIANRMPRRIPHDRQRILLHLLADQAYRLLRQRRQRRHRGRGFTFALQRRERLVDLFARLRLSTLPTTNSVMASGVYHC